MDTIRFYVSHDKVPDGLKGNLKSETKTTSPGLDKDFIEEKFDILDPSYTFGHAYYEVTVITRFHSQAILPTGIYMLEGSADTYEKTVAKYHNDLGYTKDTIDAIGRLDLEDPGTQKYVLHVRARKENVLRRMVIQIRQRFLKPAISFGNSGSKEE